jgi:hypothetical protein
MHGQRQQREPESSTVWLMALGRSSGIILHLDGSGVLELARLVGFATLRGRVRRSHGVR